MFTWQAVSGADHYVFQLGGASGFNPFQYAVDTKNTRVALLSALQAGDYTWRVAAVSSTGAQGAWSTVRGFTIDWSDTAAPQSPTDGASIVYPQPLLLNWATVPGAQEYRLTVSTAADLSTPVGGTPVTTAASAYALTDAAAGRHLLLGRHADRRAEPRRHAVRRLLVHVLLAERHDALR